MKTNRLNEADPLDVLTAALRAGERTGAGFTAALASMVDLAAYAAAVDHD